MAVQITSTPVAVPTGLRLSVGTLNFNGATYSVAGNAFTAAQWGGGVNGIPARLPDFVLFGTGSSAATGASTAGVALRYFPATGKVTVYGTEPLVDEEGLGEDDAAASSVQATFLAIWLEASPTTLA